MGRVMRTREAQFLPDVDLDPDFVRADPLVVSEISCPLRSHGQFLGVLNVESRRPLDRRDLATVSVVADRVAAALALGLEREKLAHLAAHDALTGLHNRRHFDEALAGLRGARARLPRDASSPLAVILFDLDHFGRFNKQHGHQTGDEVLRAFAAILRKRFRDSDILARYGGEEFVVVLPGATADDAAKAAEWVRRAFAASHVTTSSGLALSVTVSAGCTGSTDVSVSPENLIGVADVGLAMAKRAGRDRVVVA
jgi:diguanylate cyclase (GGDEF)-like protein